MDINKKTNGNLELRIIIIGDEKVGKKTLAKRIQMLHCSKTKIIENNLKLYNETKEEKRKKKLKKLIYINKELETSEEKDQKQNFDYRDKKTVLFTERELKIERERKQLMSIQKILKFYFRTIKISVFPCIEIQPLLPNDIDEGKNEILDDFEKKYNQSMKGLINEIGQIISLPVDDSNNNVEILFLFCFDLSNYKSFKSIYLYYNELNREFNIKKNYNMALIGNKNDIKKLMKERQKKYLQNFINKINIKYYEISSLLYFNFEAFFEKLFFDIFENSKYNFNTKEFRDKFHNMINERTNFSKSQKTLILKDIYPSPNKYHNNPFEYPLNKKTLVNLFKSKNKYNKKIYIDKKGPLYPILLNKKEDDLKEDNYKNTIKNIIKTSKEKKSESFFMYTEVNQNLKNFLEPYSHRPGYSLAGFHSEHSLSLRNNRRKINIEKNKEVVEAFDNGINFMNRKKLKKIKSYNRSFNSLSQRKKYKNKIENEKILKERHFNVKLKNKSLEDEKINRILEKEKKYDKKFIQRKQNLYKSKLNYFKKQLKASLSLKPKKIDFMPKAKFYDTFSSFSLKKGFSFGKKYENKNLNYISPEYQYLLDDFEKIVKKYKNKKGIKSYSERFPKFQTEEIDDYSREILEKKQKDFELNRKKLKSNAFSDFFDYMKRYRNAFTLKKEKIKEKEEEKYNELVNNKYFLTEIQYSQVETSYPKYSITGKGIIKKKDYRGNNEDSDLSGDEDIFKIIEEEKPNIGKVKPNYPKYSFGKEERFKKTYSYIGKNRNKKIDFNEEESRNWLFKNGIFGYNDKQSYLKTQTFMGLEKRMKDYKDNGVPGPGQYSIKGFADLITVKTDKKRKISKTERNLSEK